VYFFASETSGEKLYEEFYTDEEALDMEQFAELGIIKNATRRSRKELDDIVTEVAALFETPVEKQDIVIALKKLLPGFSHIETGINLDQKM
jgi:FlaA1/EpsC-like NDP-sugar epimerase